MAATALISTSVKVTGVESANSLASQIYEIAKRFNATNAPAVVESGHVDTGAVSTWSELKNTTGSTTGEMDTVEGLIIYNDGDQNVEVDLTFDTTEVADLIILPGEANFVSPGLVGAESIIKIRSADAAGTSYEFVMFGPATA